MYQRLALILATPVVAALVIAPSAVAADDTTPPTLKLPRSANLVEGSTIGAMSPDPDTGEPLATSSIPMNVAWSADDPSGICAYRFQATYAGTEPDDSGPVLQTSLTVPTTDYDDQQGGGSLKLEGYDISAYDCAGNSTTQFSSFLPYVFQDDGASYGWGNLQPTYSDGWSTSHCTCWSGGTTHKTSTPGASVRFSVDLNRRGAIGLVMETAPNRGQVQVYVGNVLRRTIDTSAATATHRVVVWADRLRRGTHHILLVNVGTPGRPRIDFDAVLLGERQDLG